MKRHAIARLGLIVALIVAGTVVTAAPSAEAQQLTCRSGDACVYNSSGQVIYRNPGNTGNITINAGNGKVWNNGGRYPGADHIQLRTTWAGYRWTICLHYGPQTTSQPDPTVARLASGETVKGWTWRGECVGAEDTWQRVGPA